MSKPAQARKVSPAKAAASRENGKKGGRPKKPRRTEVYAAHGDPPPDPLAIVAWGQGIVATALRETCLDEDITERERRGEIARLQSKLIQGQPLVHMYETRELIKREHAELEEDDIVEVERAPELSEPALRPGAPATEA